MDAHPPGNDTVLNLHSLSINPPEARQSDNYTQTSEVVILKIE